MRSMLFEEDVASGLNDYIFLFLFCLFSYALFVGHAGVKSVSLILLSISIYCRNFYVHFTMCSRDQNRTQPLGLLNMYMNMELVVAQMHHKLLT